MADREITLLLLDTNPIEWSKPKGPSDLTIKEFLDQVFAFLTQMILSDIFQIAPVIAYNQYGARWMFPLPDRASQVISGRLQATNPDEVLSYCSCIVENLQSFANDCAASPITDDRGVRLDVALSLALCHLNKYHPESRKRILVLTRSADPVVNFESTMNAIFAAHRINVVIDSVLISLPSSLFLNQAALLTHGFSISVTTRVKCLMQYLLTIPPLTVRPYFLLKRVKAIDYKTPAVNTKNLIDMGLMCPVCLSVYEDTGKPMGRCVVCHTREQI
jgi:transcription initiation factor TFIIH subunit 3